MSAQWTIALGFWMNESKNGLLGGTLTTSSPIGLILVSAIAIFVGMLSGYMWGIVCFIIHQVQCNRRPNDGLYHQQQVLLRNSDAPTSAVWQLFKLGKVWKGRAHNSFWRVAPLMVVGTAQLIAFTAAGIFSSEIFNQTDEVLVKSDACGYLVASTKPIPEWTQDDWAHENAQAVESRTAADMAKTYARACYGTHQDPSTNCNFFAVSQINSTQKVISCPFADEMCKKPNDGALTVDSGLINTDGALGMNSRHEHSINYRRVTTCAPLQTNNFCNVSTHPGESTLPNEYFLDCYYGEYFNYIDSNEPQKYTFTLSSYVGNGSAVAYASWYAVNLLEDPEGSIFTPIDQLKVNDADVSLIFVNTNLFYSAPVHDLFYNATVKNVGYLGSGSVMYQNLDPLIVMGCKEQHQFCDSVNRRDCSPLTGYAPAAEWAYEKWKHNGKKRDVLEALGSSLANNFLSTMIGALGSDAMLAKLDLQFETTRISGPLPDNQWQIEIRGWHDFLLARLQRLVVNVATGPSDPKFNKYVSKPSADETRQWSPCDHQKVRDSRYYSFSLLGLAVTIAIGLLIIITNLTLPSIVGWFQRKLAKHWTRGIEKREDWFLDGVFQLQRIAWDESKLGTWHYKDQEIPVTLKSEGFKDQKFGKPRRLVGSYEELNEAPSLGFTYPDSTFDTNSRHYSQGSVTTFSTSGLYDGDPNGGCQGEEMQNLTSGTTAYAAGEYTSGSLSGYQDDVGASHRRSYTSSIQTRDFV